MATTVLERAAAPNGGPAPRLVKADEAAPGPASTGHHQALDAMLYAARRMGLAATERQIATLLTVAERHLVRDEGAGGEDAFPHGTMRGYRRHRRRRETACEDCRRACRLASADRRKRERVKRPQKPCGTEAAYHRHRRRWEAPCEACRTAHRTYMREYREQRERQAAAA
ncbi:hypothetical protein [Streptomyces tendae]|uniref:hypothetical protein n=1 Tax=Streptomyces tendae TaxID=1932 RepID=UPI003EBA2488